jgi:hypothetical protein
MENFKISENQNPPQDFPKILYKYRNWEYDFHKRILENNELYLSSPKNFNDPFDCRIEENFYSLNNDELITEYIEKIQKDNSDYFISNKISVEKDFMRILSMLKSDISKVHTDMNRKLFEMQDIHYGVLSMSTLWDSILMWGHYANKHKGFCVGFYEEKLRSTNKFGKGGLVQYVNKFPKINPLSPLVEKALIQTHYKAKEWEYEKEFRMTKTFFPKIPNDNDRTVNLSNDCIAEVILGLNITKEHELIIMEIARKKNIPIYKINKENFKFKLERFELNNFTIEF